MYCKHFIKGPSLWHGGEEWVQINEHNRHCLLFS